MSAAALRPNLFEHLFASQPEGPDRSSVAATLSSLALHTSLLAAACWLSVTFAPSKLSHVDEMPPQLVITVSPAPTSPQPSAGGGSPGTPSAGAYPIPEAPIINPPGAWNNIASEFATPDLGSGDSKEGNSASGGTQLGDAVREDGFRILAVMPALQNERAVRDALSRNYPPMLRDAGVSGSVLVWVLLDEGGRVLSAEVKESSGHRALDEAALKVAPIMKFSPAMNRDQRVRVWVSVPVRFKTD